MKRIELNGGKIVILPVIKGLVSEEKEIEKAFDEVRPEIVGISISKEELEGLAHKEEYDHIEPSSVEMVYMDNLSCFGEVRIPPPCYVKTMDLCEERGIGLVPLDMNEELFSETYCDLVSGFDLLRDSYFSSRMDRIKFNLSSPENFVMDWDKKVNKGNGFKELAKAREEHMVKVLKNLSCNSKTIILAVIEIERARGISNLIK